MTDSFRVRFVRAVSDEIGGLSGGRFEQFCYRVLDATFPPQAGSWVERGTTVEGAPRGYGIDASADGARTVAEVSSEQSYLDDALDKPRRDITHALALHPRVSQILLLSCREAPPGRSTELDNLVSAAISESSKLRSVVFLDARAIATRILENLDSDAFVRSLEPFLSSLRALHDEFAISHRLPRYDDYVPRPTLETDIAATLRACGRAHLAGISGAGKTAAASRVAHALRDEYDSVFWVAGESISRATDLGDVDVRRNGVRHNLLAAMRRRKCLIVIDDIRFSPGDVAALDLGPSAVITTSQYVERESVVVGSVDAATAKSIITQGVATEPPPELNGDVLAGLGGHALLLSILNRLAREEGWDAVMDCLEDAPAGLEDDTHQKLCQRILRAHAVALADELAFVRWCDSAVFDLELSRVCVHARLEANLKRRAFFSASASGIGKMHSLVYASVLREVTPTPQQNARFAAELKRHIRIECHSDRPTIQRISNLHEALMTRLSAEDECAEFVYVMALARYAGASVDRLSAWIETAPAIAARPFTANREVEFRATIEAIEAKYTLLSNTAGKQAAKSALALDMSAFVALASTRSLPASVLRDIRHHRAKMLTRLDRNDEAAAEFREILADDALAAATRLQLARLLAQTGDGTGALHEAETVCSQHCDGSVDVSPRVLLEALRVIASGPSVTPILKYEALILDTVSVLDHTVWQWSVELVAQIAQKLWYKAPTMVVRLFNSVDWETVVPRSDRDRFDWAQAFKYAAQANSTKPNERTRLLRVALDHYSEIARPLDYHLTNYAECLHLLDEHQAALGILTRVGDGGRNEALLTFVWVAEGNDRARASA